MKERLINYRMERIASLESGEAVPLPPELCYPDEPVEQHELPWDTLQRPVDLTPYEASQVRHWEQRRRARRISDAGKR